MRVDKAQKGGEQDLALLQAATEAFAHASSLGEDAEDVIRSIAEGLGWQAGVIWTVDHLTDMLHCAGVWSASGVDAHKLMSLTTGAACPRGVGVPGRAWTTGAPTLATEVEGDPFGRTDAATAAGLPDAMALPLVSGGETLGVLELFAEHVERPEHQAAILAILGAQVAQLIRSEEAEERARDATERYRDGGRPEEGDLRSMVERLPAVLYVRSLDEDLTVTFVSSQIGPLLGMSPEEYMADPQAWYRHLHPADRERALLEYRRGCERGEPFGVEYRVTGPLDRVRWVRDNVVPDGESDDTPTVAYGVIIDVTDGKEVDEGRELLVHRDQLTGLPDGQMFGELLDLALARAHRQGLSVTVLHADMDDFQVINETLGEAAGDELLRQVAGRLRESTRETDVLSRGGDDEFLLLLSGQQRGAKGLADTEHPALLVAASEASRIHESLQAPFVVAGTEFYLSASIGISIVPLDAKDRDSLLRNAETAMRRSKKLGPGRYVVFSNDTQDRAQQLSMTTRLRKAVERQHWALHYQPIMDLVGGQMVGVEALLRWKDPRGGLVSPAEFITLAEEMGLIETIGDWVIEEICRQSRAWGEDGMEVDISFNLSPRQLWQPELVQRVQSHLESTGLDPTTLVIEVPESAAMTDPDRTQRILRDLHELGVRLAIDAFGSGYASLSRLRNVPADILKIDRFFIDDVPADPNVGGMVRAIIQLGHSLAMTPLAVGISTEEQRGFLADLGCPLGQGYLFSGPVDAAEITERCMNDGFAAPLEGAGQP